MLVKKLFLEVTELLLLIVVIIIAFRILDFRNGVAGIVALLLETTFILWIGGMTLIVCYKTIADFMGGEAASFLGGFLSPSEKAEKLAIALGWWIPRKYRGVLVGDILEDCHEMREKGWGELRIRIQVLWQWAIAVGTLIPAAIFGAVWRILSPPK